MGLVAAAKFQSLFGWIEVPEVYRDGRHHVSQGRFQSLFGWIEVPEWGYPVKWCST